MSWQRVRGHEAQIEAFDRVVRRGRLAHAYLFTGPAGTGKRLFADGAVPAGLKVDAVKTSTTGVVIATYERAGAIKYGSFALEEPSDAATESREGTVTG